MDRTYFDRQLKLADFGEAAQQKLLNAKVLIVGAGGLGCPLLQYLVTAGVGTLGVIDGDQVQLSNLHRQILYNQEDIGKNKASVAVSKLRSLRPEASLLAYEEDLREENADALFSAYDLIVDGSDNFHTRYLVNDHCLSAGLPFVSGAIDRYQGQVSVFNYQGGPTYRCLFPEAPADGACYSCAENGVLNILPGLVAMYMANEVIKVLSGTGTVLSGQLMILDIRTNAHQLLSFKRNAPVVASVRREAAPEVIRKAALDTMLQADPDLQVIDVREEWEEQEDSIGGLNIPLYQLQERLKEIDPERPVAFVCATGNRSKMAYTLIKDQLSLKGNVLLVRLD